MMHTHLSLFSGFGGLDLAAEQEGFRTVGQCEWAEYPRKVLEKHWPDVPRWRDIRTLTEESFYEKTGLRTVDILSGGFPCQPFSVAGQRRGKSDDRFLWPEMLRVIREIRPTWVLGENVAGLLSMAEPIGDAQVESRTINRYPESDHYLGIYTQQERMLLGNILEEIEACGYEVTVFCVPACGVDAPHRRDRLAIIAHANGDGRGAQRAEPAGQQRQAGAANGGEDVGHAQHDGLPAATHTGGADAHSDACPQGAGTTEQPARAGGRRSYADVADANGAGSRQREDEKHATGGGEQAQCRPAECGEAMADTDRTQRWPQCGQCDGLAERPDSLQERAQSAGGFERGGTDVSNTDSQRREERDAAAIAGGAGFAGFGCDEDAADAEREQRDRSGRARGWWPEPANGGWWPVEPRLGRVAHGVAHRVERLKGLGNMAAPPQFRPFFNAIREVLEGEAVTA